MLMDGVEIMEDESQDGPTITLVNFEEFEAQFLDNSHNQHFLADGLLEEEAENVSSGNVRFFGGNLVWFIYTFFLFTDC